MKRDPYRDQANKSRQELKTANERTDTQDESAGEKSRLALHSKKRDEKASQKKPFPLIRVLLALFVLLPLTVTILSITFFDNEDSVTNATLSRDNSVQLDKPESKNAAVNEEKDTAEKKQQPAKESDAVELEKETAKKEEEPAVEAVKPVEEPVDETPVEEPEAPAEEPEEEAPPAEEPPAEETTGSGTHTVQSSETLFRISVNYYGSGDFVDQIKQMNGLQTNDIHEGQVLKMP
ncbi:LysM domain-containing protein [Jeotgalibacillus sp. S-D1]|uniref:LysM peptidoglycan-binding domain-containing protein n=1 Tax=Jeotgalibacillus sp. S-D1 TaxID=2552189 RepID=UPI001059C507|nr:LysM peptidoglycan-binding domain-containing protein [Jeotgalibacillus sp. S-D1]TDL34708.1 LysM domain-containing protein [Jeotgalibacillus sp. S-D1]